MAYFSNSTEGDVLACQCAECHVSDEAACPVLAIQLMYNYAQLDEGNKHLKEAMNMLVDEDGQCQMKQIIDSQLIENQKTIPMFQKS